MPRRSRIIRAVKKLRRQLEREERQYYREIRALYRTWFSNLISRLGFLTGLKLDAERSDSPIEDLLRQALGEWRQVVQTFTVRIEKRVNRIRELSQIFWSDIAGVDLSVQPVLSEPWLQPALDAFAEQNAALITKIGVETATEVQRVVQDGQLFGRSQKEIAAEIRKISNKFGINRSRLIARDQISKLNGQLTMMRSQRSGIDEYIWSTSQDERVRPSHREKNNKKRNWNENPIPGEEIQCRCVAIPLISNKV